MQFETVAIQTCDLSGTGFWQNRFFADFYFFEPPDFSPILSTVFFLFIFFVGKSAQKFLPGEAPQQNPPKYIKIPDTLICRGAGPRFGHPRSTVALRMQEGLGGRGQGLLLRHVLSGLSASAGRKASQAVLPTPKVPNPGTTPITILAVNSDHGLSFAGEEWSEFPFLYRFTVLLNSGGSNSPWSEFWSEFLHFMGMGVVPAPSKRG